MEEFRDTFFFHSSLDIYFSCRGCSWTAGQDQPRGKLHNHLNNRHTKKNTKHFSSPSLFTKLRLLHSLFRVGENWESQHGTNMKCLISVRWVQHWSIVHHITPIGLTRVYFYWQGRHCVANIPGQCMLPSILIRVTVSIQAISVTCLWLK